MAPTIGHAGKWGEVGGDGEKLVSWIYHCSAECLNEFPKSVTVVKFPHPASQGCYEMDQMERKAT